MAAPRLTEDQARAVSYAARQRDFTAFVEAWLDRELHELPHALGNTAVAQGRCQVLMELSKLLEGTLTHTG